MREFCAQISCQAINYVVPPRFGRLPGENGLSYVPIQLDHGGIHHALRPPLCFPDEAFQSSEGSDVIYWEVRLKHGHDSTPMGRTDAGTRSYPDGVWTTHRYEGVTDIQLCTVPKVTPAHGQRQLLLTLNFVMVVLRGARHISRPAVSQCGSIPVPWKWDASFASLQRGWKVKARTDSRESSRVAS